MRSTKEPISALPQTFRMGLLVSSKKLIIVLLIAFLGLGNLVVGAWSFVTVNSLDLPARVSGLSSQLDSLDTSLIKTVELQESISTIKQSAVEELNYFVDYSEMLNTIPVYFIIMGALFLIISLVAYFVISDAKKLNNA